MRRYELLCGEALDRLGGLEAGRCRCCVTSPPYWGLRDYGIEGQVGLEATPASYISRLVAILRAVRRVLADDGLLWVVMGDSYAQARGHGHWEGRGGKGDESGQKITQRWAKRGAEDIGLKPKDLIGVPWMLAFALRDDGWFLRSEVIWAKGNAMPESVKDRCTRSHETVFMLSKSPRYYFDQEVIREKRAASQGNRNRRSVWEVNTQAYKEAHFAVFPPTLIEPMILASSQVGDTVLDPFMGSGTTGVVALLHLRQFVGIEINPDYVELAGDRIRSTVTPKAQREARLRIAWRKHRRER